MMQLLERKQLKDMAHKQLEGHWGNMALRTFLISVITMGAASIPYSGFMVSVVMSGTSGRMTPAGGSIAVICYLLMLAVIILAMPMQYGFIHGCMKLRSGEPSQVGIIFSKYNMLPKILMLLVYEIIFVLASMIVFVPALLLMDKLPPLGFVLMLAWYVAIFYIAIRVSMCTYILVENPYTSVWTSIKQSWNLMKGHIWRYLVLDLSFLGWILLAMLTCGILMYWVTPYMTMTFLNFYYDLKGNTLAQAEEAAVEFVN